MVPTEYSKDFINEIPSCKLHMIEDRGHISHIEKPIKFTKVIQDFLLLSSYDLLEQEEEEEFKRHCGMF
jgi:pimeloyl-ACP methyl ester carboxylesterase